MPTTTPTSSDVLAKIGQGYPHQVELGAGHLVELRLMGSDDIDAVLAFARTLKPEDLMFLQVNITEREVVQHWVEAVVTGRTITVLAVADGQVVGEASLHHRATSWTRHLGEIRLQISPSARGKGLARVLANEVDAIAKQLGLQLLTARMTLDQSAAQAVFRHLGFQREAVLWDYVITPDGKTRNLLVATKRL